VGVEPLVAHQLEGVVQQPGQQARQEQEGQSPPPGQQDAGRHAGSGKQHRLPVGQAIQPPGDQPGQRPAQPQQKQRRAQQGGQQAGGQLAAQADHMEQALHNADFHEGEAPQGQLKLALSE